MHVIQFLSTKIWILKWRKWLFIQWNIDKFQENWKSLTFIINLTSMSMTQFYVETEGLWFGPKIKMIWESALWIWHFCYQHRLVVLDAICCSWQLNIFLDIEAPPPTIWASKPPHYFLRTQHPPTEVHPDQWISWSLVTLVHPRPRLRHQSGSGGDPVQSCSDHCIAWSLHLMYTYLIYHSPSIRGPRPMLLLWSVCLLVNIMQVDSKKWLTKRNISIF